MHETYKDKDKDKDKDKVQVQVHMSPTYGFTKAARAGSWHVAAGTAHARTP